MATYGPLIDDGSQCISGFDARNSSITGTTLNGPNGSGQFLVVGLSTTVDRTVNLTTLAGMRPYGVLQNKPSTGLAADVGIMGITKAIAGAAITRGSEVMTSTLGGMLIAYSSAANQYSCGRALESASSGQVFTCAWYSFGAGAQQE